jgi:hypothetical protein
VEHSDDRFRSLNGQSRLALQSPDLANPCLTKAEVRHPILLLPKGRRSSVGSNVDIAENARFKFQITQPVFNHVAYADNASQLAVAKHRHVAHAMASHQVHQVGEIIPEGRGDQAVRHDLLYLHRRNWLAVLRKRAHDIAFGDNTENGVIARNH